MTLIMHTLTTRLNVFWSAVVFNIYQYVLFQLQLSQVSRLGYTTLTRHNKLSSVNSTKPQ